VNAKAQKAETMTKTAKTQPASGPSGKPLWYFHLSLCDLVVEAASPQDALALVLKETDVLISGFARAYWKSAILHPEGKLVYGYDYEKKKLIKL
jgi:hypothetical protein